MVAVKKNQPAATVQNTNETVRDAPKMSHQPVGVWSERPRSAKIKTAKISSEGSGRCSAKICTSENYLSPLNNGLVPRLVSFWSGDEGSRGARGRMVQGGVTRLEKK